MRSGFFWAAALSVAGLGVALDQTGLISPQLTAEASSTLLLEGCTDVPEAVALADTLRLRGIAIDRALADMERRKQEIAAAELRLKTRLDALKSAKAALGDANSARLAGTAEGIDRLIAVYDAMKPAEAAPVLAALPPDFAAEILTRIQPDASARIIARVDPGQAAILTAHMGSRRISKD